jgi:hypothetical protein
MQRSHQPSYQGRALPRPDDEVVDQGLGFDLGTLLGRRQLLRAFGLGATTLGLAACDGTSDGKSPTATTATATSGEIPDSGIVRSDLRSSFGTASGTAEGVPMTLELTVLDVANGGRPFAGTAVYLWHCDREGRYSLYSEGVEDQNYLRGVQIADAGNAIATSQVALPKDACDKVYAQTGYQASVPSLADLTLESDNVFGDDAGASQLGTATGDVTAGYAVSLPVRVDTRTAPGGGQLSRDGRPAGAPGGPGAPSGASGPPPSR